MGRFCADFRRGIAVFFSRFAISCPGQSVDMISSRTPEYILSCASDERQTSHSVHHQALRVVGLRPNRPAGVDEVIGTAAPGAKRP